MTTLSAQSTGDGKKLLIFVHGNSQSLHVWESVINQDILDTYTCIAVDLPGHGNSFRSHYPKADYSLRGLAVHLLSFLKAYTNEEYILIGTSLGSNVVGELNPFPPNCKGAFFAAAMLSSGNVTLADMVQPNPSIGAAFNPNPTPEELDNFIANIIHQPSASQIAAYKVDFKRTDPNLRAYLGQSIAQQIFIDEVANLNAAGIPIGVAYGAEEKLIQIGYLNRTPLSKWRNHIYLIPDAGHCLQLAQPKALAKLIAEFAEDCLG
jgi:pimeloyl-ACP methyl ester carboxylesterase